MSTAKLTAVLPPPPDGDRDSGPVLIWLQTVLVATALILVLLRLYVRATVVRNMSLDDLFIVLGLVHISVHAAAQSC